VKKEHAMATIDLPKLIADNASRFTGRTWLLPELLEWLEKSDKRIFLLIGGPGTGKSMIQAWLANYGPEPDDPEACTQLRRLREQVAGAHFCQSNSRNLSPQAFASNLANQLTRNVKGFGNALVATLAERVQINSILNIGTMSDSSATGIFIDRLDLGTLGDELSFDRAFTQPLKKLYESGYDQPLLLLVDALDVALTYTGQKNLVHLLATLADLPPQVRILATTRSDPRVLMTQHEARKFDLIKDAPKNCADVLRYVETRLASPSNGLNEPARKHLANQIASKAEGIFLYAALVLDDLLPRLPAAANLETYPLPESLGDVYAQFLLREVGQDDSRWFDFYEPLLGLIAVAQGEGLTTTQLTTLLDRDIRQALRASKQYLDGELPNGPFRLFHKSFADFLLEDEHNLDRHIEAAEMHRRIAEHYWTKHHADWPGCDAYGLNSLATHLYRGGQFERLDEMISQPWMVARYNGGGYTYDGFIADLTLAWEHAHAETERQLESEHQTALAQCVKYALIRTSISSLSSNYVPALVARAVKTGLWTPERALSVAGRMLNARERDATYSALLATEKLTGDQLTRAQHEGLAAALALGEEEDQALALAVLSPHLTSEQSRQGLAAASTFKSYENRVKALSALAPRLTETDHQQALQMGLAAALCMDSEWGQADALATLAPHLTGELLRQGLAAALVFSDKEHRVRTLTALAPRLTGEDQQRALQQGLADALTILSHPTMFEPSAYALAALAPLLKGELLEKGLADALALPNSWFRAKALIALAPKLTGELLRQAWEAALTLDAGYLGDVMAALAPRLIAENCLQALQQGLEVALAIGHETDFSFQSYYRGHQAKALAALAPYLTGEAHQHALKKGLEAALSMDGKDQVEVLVALAPQLTDADRHQALQQGLVQALSFKNEWDREDALATLAPQLTGEQLQQGLDAALAIDDKWYRVKALAALIPRLPEEKRQRDWRQALAAALAIGNEEYRADALADLAPQLTGELLQQALVAALAFVEEKYREKALNALTPYLTDELLLQGLTAALSIDDEREWALALGSLAPHLTDKLLQQGLAAALTFNDGEWKAEALAALAPRLTGELLQQGIAAALAIQNGGACAYALAALAPQLTGEPLQQALQKGLEVVTAIEDEPERGKALALLAPHLTDELLQRGLAAALTISVGDHEEWLKTQLTLIPHDLKPPLTGEYFQQIFTGNLWYRALALSALAPRLTGELLQQALSAALSMDDSLGERVLVLNALAPQLTGDLLRQALHVALAFDQEGERALALAALAPQLIDEQLQQGLGAALVFDDEVNRALALAALAPRLTGKDHQRALETAMSIGIGSEADMARVKALAALASQLTGDARQQTLQKGLAQTLAIGDEDDRASALITFAPWLTGELFQQAWVAALALGNEAKRLSVLAALVPQLTDELSQQALAAALAFDDEWWRAKALATVASRLTGDLLQQALATALTLSDEWCKAEALAALAPFVSQQTKIFTHIRQAMDDQLWRNLSCQERRVLLAFCADRQLFTPPMLDSDTLAIIGGHINEVCAQWQWL